MRRTPLLSTTALCTAVLLGTPAFSADMDRMLVAHDTAPATLPAVSAANWKVAGFASQLSFEDSEVTAYGAAAAFSVPISHSWGAQFDGVFGSADGSEFYGIAGHLFWRDPAKGLVGLYGSYLGWDADGTIPAPIEDDIGVADVTGADVGKIGVEAEAYLGNASVEGRLVYQFGDRNGVAGNVTLAYYLHENFRVDGGYRYLEGLGHQGTLGAEWAPKGHMSLFVDGAVGEDDYARVTGGLKVYFSDDTSKSLMRRHREDDPDIELPDDLFQTIGDARCPDGYALHEEDGYIYCAPNK